MVQSTPFRLLHERIDAVAARYLLLHAVENPDFVTTKLARASDGAGKGGASPFPESAEANALRVRVTLLVAAAAAGPTVDHTVAYRPAHDIPFGRTYAKVESPSGAGDGSLIIPVQAMYKPLRSALVGRTMACEYDVANCLPTRAAAAAVELGTGNYYLKQYRDQRNELFAQFAKEIAEAARTKDGIAVGDDGMPPLRPEGADRPPKVTTLKEMVLADMFKPDKKRTTKAASAPTIYAGIKWGDVKFMKAFVEGFNAEILQLAEAVLELPQMAPVRAAKEAAYAKEVRDKRAQGEAKPPWNNVIGSVLWHYLSITGETPWVRAAMDVVRDRGDGSTVGAYIYDAFSAVPQAAVAGATGEQPPPISAEDLTRAVQDVFPDDAPVFKAKKFDAVGALATLMGRTRAVVEKDLEDVAKLPAIDLSDEAFTAPDWAAAAKHAQVLLGGGGGEPAPRMPAVGEGSSAEAKAAARDNVFRHVVLPVFNACSFELQGSSGDAMNMLEQDVVRDVARTFAEGRPVFMPVTRMNTTMTPLFPAATSNRRAPGPFTTLKLLGDRATRYDALRALAAPEAAEAVAEFLCEPPPDALLQLVRDNLADSPEAHGQLAAYLRTAQLGFKPAARGAWMCDPRHHVVSDVVVYPGAPPGVIEVSVEECRRGAARVATFDDDDGGGDGGGSGGRAPDDDGDAEPPRKRARRAAAAVAAADTAEEAASARGATRKVYNAWGGFAYPGDGRGDPDYVYTDEQRRADLEEHGVQRFINALRNLVRGNHAEDVDAHANFLLTLFASVFQHPERKSSVMVLLRGKQGKGKDSVINKFLELFSAAAVLVSVDAERDMLSRFNSQLIGKSVVVCQELELPASAQARLKGLITADRLAFEEKGKPLKMHDNYASFFSTSNAFAGLCLEQGDNRRYIVFEAVDDPVPGVPGPWTQAEWAEWHRDLGTPEFLQALARYTAARGAGAAGVERAGAAADHGGADVHEGDPLGHVGRAVPRSARRRRPERVDLRHGRRRSRQGSAGGVDAPGGGAGSRRRSGRRSGRWWRRAGWDGGACAATRRGRRCRGRSGRRRRGGGNGRTGDDARFVALPGRGVDAGQRAARSAGAVGGGVSAAVVRVPSSAHDDRAGRQHAVCAQGGDGGGGGDVARAA